jgi:hypothetical protein
MLDSGRTPVTTRIATLGAVFVALLAACGSSNDASAPAAPSKAKADVTIRLDGVHHVCNVALPTEEHPSSIACADVAAFVRDELRVPSGAVYDLRADPQGEPSELTSISASLKNAGYRSAR